ncbi:MAG TPA: vitamin B12-dependent ribonucleotide reductase, partial [Terriglobales bacterium]|nr:vitamin B12-dependent ribonucleotide reductase [Terriglobales bacterium]
SVRVSDEFMQAAEADGAFALRRVAGERKGEAIKTVDAKGLLRQMAEAAWQCGDPGIQYDTTVNKWHTSKNTARINASNPCSEYMFLDDSACNLASINLMKFSGAGGFDVAGYRQAVNVLITAQEIIVDNASYPTERIAQNSHDYRPLGLGYANLGALLMANGLPYDSDGGRDMAGALTAIMCGQAYLQSARIAEALTAPGAPEGEGAFAGFARNREPMLDVIRMHRAAVNHINPKNVAEPVMAAARQSWDEALEQGSRHGYRNAQVTVLAPTGTIGFMMDCDTTGIEPDLALVKSKKLVGGGLIKIVNQSVDKALLRLGYSAQQTHDILAFVDATSTIEGAPHLKPEHLPVFDCSFKPANGTRSIHYLGHIRMMAAAQPFLSGAISKTVNLPEAAKVDDVVQVYTEGWKLGLKAIAIYRDGSKKVQPLSAAAGKAPVRTEAPVGLSVPASVPSARPYRRRLAEERQSLTHKFKIGGHEGYITVGMYEDGQPGEIFVTMAKEGSTISGLMDSFATAISLALQHGVPLRLLVDKFSHTRFEPSGWSGNAEIGYAKSIMDYLFRWMGQKFLDHQPPAPKGVEDVHGDRGERQEALETAGQIPLITTGMTTAIDAPACHNCGSIMVPNGSCFKCVNCGETSGCS